MKVQDFRICIEGKEAEERAKQLADLIEKEFGHRPVRQLQGRPQKKERLRSFDLVAVGAIVLAVPSALLAAADLVDRIKKKKKMDALIDWAKKHPGPVTITTPDGTVIQLHKTDSGKLLDAVEEKNE